MSEMWWGRDEKIGKKIKYHRVESTREKTGLEDIRKPDYIGKKMLC